MECVRGQSVTSLVKFRKRRTELSESIVIKPTKQKPGTTNTREIGPRLYPRALCAPSSIIRQGGQLWISCSRRAECRLGMLREQIAGRSMKVEDSGGRMGAAKPNREGRHNHGKTKAPICLSSGEEEMMHDKNTMYYYGK